MYSATVRLNLSYVVTIDRSPDVTWPRLKVDANHQADVTQVSVEVVYEDGKLEARTPSITRGRILRKDGTPGRSAGTYHGYYSFWERGAEQDAINAQEQRFREQALVIAWQEFGKLSGARNVTDEAVRLSREPKAVQGVVLAQRPDIFREMIDLGLVTP